MRTELLAQTKVDIGDLTFLRMPTGSAETALQFVLIMMLVVITVIVTLSIQKAFAGWLETREQRAAAAPKMEPRLQAALDLLRFFADPVKVDRLHMDLKVFEASVAKALPTASDEDAVDIGALRRYLRMTAANTALPVISTRQLLGDQPVRIVANVKGERLDLYCSLLEVNERFLLIEVPDHEEIGALLAENPEVQLVYWREEGGEVLFDVTLEPIESDTISAYRATHAIRVEGTAHRAEFRLSVDLKTQYAYVTRNQIVQHKETGSGLSAIKGAGRLIDLSLSGAAMVAAHDLPPGGLAQLQVSLGEKPVRLMLEVLHVGPLEGGQFLVRGRFRGANAESRTRLNNFVSSEQVRRLKQRESIVTRVPAGAPAPEEPEA